MEWISVKDELPKVKAVGPKVLVYRKVNLNQRDMAYSIFDTLMVRFCEETTYWTKLPKPPKN